MDPAHFDVLIVGAGQGGAMAALALRQQCFEGSIGILGAELVAPYERPALSKDYLADGEGAHLPLLRPETLWAERGIALRLGRRVVEVDPTARQVRCQDGEIFRYRKLIWSAGGGPRPLPGSPESLEGLFVIRTKADVDALKAWLPQAQTVIIIGGGFIGLEAAAVLVEAGKTVTVIEAQERLLARVAGEPISAFFRAQHEQRGVRILCGAKVAGLGAAAGRVRHVDVIDGPRLAADAVIVGIGIEPAIAPLRAAGAICTDGVEVSETFETSLPGVYAIGDCARFECGHAGGRRIRIESIQNATDQAGAVAAAIVGEPADYKAVPWFWSSQFDFRLQTMGLSMGHERTLIRGDPASGSFSVVYLARGRLLAVDAVKRPRDYMQARSLIGLAVDEGQVRRLCDDIELKVVFARG